MVPLRARRFVNFHLIALVIGGLLVGSALAQNYTAPSNPVIGSQNTVTADPPISRPKTTPCKVQLFSGYMFADFTPKPFFFIPPQTCPGPWAKVVFEADFSVTAGRQFDRTANIWIGPTNIYFGTTAEPSHTVARSWHVESDLTEYSPVFTTAQSGEVDLGNLVNSTYTGILFGSADIEFYPLAKHQQPPVTADQVLALSAGPNGGTVDLNTGTDQLTATLNLPRNIERAYLDLFAQSQAADEFWYSCVPNDVAGELESCGNTAFREAEVSIDGQPAGVAPIYPWIYTGGIDPFLWRPIPGVHTMNFAPYRVDLTPFAGVLSNGLPHTIAVSVYNADYHFSTTASLLLYLDHGTQQVLGGITKNTIATANPQVQENLQNNNGTITGTVTVTSDRQFQVAGDALTSHGKVHTNVSQTINFSNKQNFVVASAQYVQDINQNTGITSLITSNGAVQRSDFRQSQWPLVADISLNFNPDGSGSQTTTILQALKSVDFLQDASGLYSSFVFNQASPTDTLFFDSNFNITGNQGQASAEQFFFLDTAGNCFSRSIAAADGALTSVSKGDGCDHH